MLYKHQTDSAIKNHQKICGGFNFIDSFDEKMLSEKNRLETFKYWPVPWIDVKELAKDGFYFTGTGDIVECRFCRLRIYSWEGNDIVKEEHYLHAPYCPLVRTPFETNNEEMKKKDYAKCFDEKHKLKRKTQEKEKSDLMDICKSLENLSIHEGNNC